MSLSLLVPISLALGALLAGPVLAHLARQKPVERIPFGAMILLRRLVKRVRRQRRIRDPFLLLLRLLVVLALVFAATQPRLVWEGDTPEAGLSGRVVFVVDNSLSMAQVDEGQTLFSKAREAALERLEQLPIGAQIAVVSMGGAAEAFSDSLHGQLDRARANLESIQQSYGGTDLVGGLHAARILLQAEAGEVLVFTDEAGPSVMEEASLELELLLGIGASVIPVPLQSETPQNIAVAHAEYGEGLEGGSILTRVQNFGPSSQEVLLTVGLPDGSEISAFVDVGPFESAEERITVPPEVPGGVAWARVEDPSSLWMTPGTSTSREWGQVGYWWSTAILALLRSHRRSTFWSEPWRLGVEGAGGCCLKSRPSVVLRSPIGTATEWSFWPMWRILGPMQPPSLILFAKGAGWSSLGERMSPRKATTELFETCCRRH